MKTFTVLLLVVTVAWQTIDFHGLFTFKLPQEFVRLAANNADENRAEYQKGETKLIVIWGHSESAAYQDRKQDSMHDYRETTTRIRGRRANIRTYWLTAGSQRAYRAELNIGNWEQGEVQIYMRLESNDATMMETADQIFKSINLPLPAPERPSNP